MILFFSFFFSFYGFYWGLLVFLLFFLFYFFSRFTNLFFRISFFLLLNTSYVVSSAFKPSPSVAATQHGETQMRMSKSPGAATPPRASPLYFTTYFEQNSVADGGPALQPHKIQGRPRLAGVFCINLYFFSPCAHISITTCAWCGWIRNVHL